MASALKLAKPLSLVVLVIFGAIFGQLVFSTSSVSALTNDEQRQCMSELDGKQPGQLTAAQRDLYTTKCSTAVAGGICTTKTITIGGGASQTTRTTYSCTLDLSATEDATPTAQAAEVEPLQTLICGKRPTDQNQYQYEWQPCAAAVATLYNTCSVNSAPGSPTDGTQVSADATAACMRPKLSSISGAKTPTLAQLTAAVTSGRDAYDK